MYRPPRMDSVSSAGMMTTRSSSGWILRLGLALVAVAISVLHSMFWVMESFVWQWVSTHAHRVLTTGRKDKPVARPVKRPVRPGTEATAGPRNGVNSAAIGPTAGLADGDRGRAAVRAAEAGPAGAEGAPAGLAAKPAPRRPTRLQVEAQ